MLIAFALAVGAAALGVARGGTLEALAATKLRWTALLVGGLGLQVTLLAWSPTWLTGARALLVLVVSNLALVVFIAGNRRLPGMLVADVGLALNLLVIVANGAMPVSVEAARAAGIGSGIGAPRLEHEPMGPNTVLSWFGDVIPVPRLGEVWSVGDLVLAAGIARLVYVRTTARLKPRATVSRASG